MSSMSYCAFQNTADELGQCLEILEETDGELSSEEYEAAKRMMNTLRSILEYEDRLSEGNLS